MEFCLQYTVAYGNALYSMSNLEQKRNRTAVFVHLYSLHTVQEIIIQQDLEG